MRSTQVACVICSVVTGTIARIDRSAVHDGPGIRTIVFFKGCPLRCHWCHSPETQSPRPEVMLYGDRCLSCGACEAVCPAGQGFRVGRGFSPASPGTVGRGFSPARTIDRTRCQACGECTVVCPTGARELVGRTLSVGDVVKAIERDTVFHDHSAGGVTMSGGEPLNQPMFLEALLRQCRARRIHTAVETCGFAPPRTLLSVARWTDLFLYDLKIIDEDRHIQATGQSNRRILENLPLLCARHHGVRVRIPLIGGVNDDRANIRAIGAFLAELPVSEVDILPYHAAGMAKYARLDRPYRVNASAVPSAEAIEDAVETLSRCGLDVQVGGTR
jgi:pyruvate formate lyase activating enzyme